jgi:hypothetical protein
MSNSAESAEEALNALLATLQRGDLSPLEFRMLLWLADRVGTQSELAVALDVSRGGRAKQMERNTWTETGGSSGSTQASTDEGQGRKPQGAS